MSYAEGIKESSQDEFIRKLEEFARKVTGMDTSVDRWDTTTDKFMRSEAIRNLTQKEPLFANVLVNEFTKRKTFNVRIEPLSSDQEEVRKKYATLIEALFALVEIAEGGLQINEYPAWKHARDAEQAERDACDARVRQALKPDASSEDAEWLQCTVKLFLGYHEFALDKRKDFEHIEDSPSDKELATQFVTSMSPQDYQTFINGILSHERGNKMVIGSTEYMNRKEANRVNAAQVQAIQDYVGDVKDDEKCDPLMLTAFMRTNPRDLQLLKETIQTIDDEEKADSRVDGSPAQRFTEAKQRQRDNA